MQRLTRPPRDHLTADQVTQLLEATRLEIVQVGLERYDADETFLEDTSDVLEPPGSSVTRGSYRTVHGTCRLRLTRELDWGADRVKPYIILDGAGIEARFDLGMYLLSTPATPGGETPTTWDVEGYDKLEVLAHPHGATFSVAAGTGVIATVTGLINDAGETNIKIAASGDDVPLPSRRTWELNEITTTLTICNELLAAIGYRALWCDADGAYRSEPYTAPSERGAEWAYDTTSPTTTIGAESMLERDYFAVPNRWVFFIDDPDPARPLPSEGDGLYTVENLADGPTSQDARGRTITSVRMLDAATHTALVTQGDRIVESDKELIRRLLNVRVRCNPLHWHFDVVQVTNPTLGVSGRWLVHDWTLPLDGGDMALTAKAV